MMRAAACGLIIALAVCAAALTAALTAPAALRSTAIGTSDAADLVWRPRPGARLPLATRLVDETSRPVALGQYFAKSPVILVLEYLECRSLCGVTLRHLVEALNGLPRQAGRDYELVAVSIDPREKPTEALAARAKYATLLDRVGSAAGLHFLTASSPAAMRGIADAVGFAYRYDSMLDAYIHPAGFAIAAPDGVISSYIEGVAISPRDLGAALADAGQNRLPGPLTRLLVLCHVRGAPLGRFTAPVLTALTIADTAAGLSLIGIFAAIRWRRG
jgi:protein SCO1/2